MKIDDKFHSLVYKDLQQSCQKYKLDKNRVSPNTKSCLREATTKNSVVLKQSRCKYSLFLRKLHLLRRVKPHATDTSTVNLCHSTLKESF